WRLIPMSKARGLRLVFRSKLKSEPAPFGGFPDSRRLVRPVLFAPMARSAIGGSPNKRELALPLGEPRRGQESKVTFNFELLDC
ncbi:hypothetical protein NIES2130_37965, partial [Scytonema sp. HK-05]